MLAELSVGIKNQRLWILVFVLFPRFPPQLFLFNQFSIFLDICCNLQPDMLIKGPYAVYNLLLLFNFANRSRVKCY